MSETILAKLRHEHREIQDLLVEIESAKSATKRHELFLEMKNKLVPHMEGEEQTLYAHLKNDIHSELTEEIIDDADLEHHELKEYLQRLNLMGPDTPEWMKEFHSFKEHVEQHIMEEETEMFEEAKEDFSVEELVHFAQEFEEAKHHPLI